MFDWSIPRGGAFWERTGRSLSDDDLLRCPESLLDEQGELLTSEDHFLQGGAAVLLYNVGRACLIAGDWRRSLWLKRLTHRYLSNGNSYDATAIVLLLQERVVSVVQSLLVQNGHSVETLNSDPEAVVDFLTHDQSGIHPATVPCILLLTAWRVADVLRDTSTIVAVRRALSEAHLCMHAQLVRDAKESIQFATSRLAQLDKEQCHFTAHCLQPLATKLYASNPLEAISLLSTAKQHCPATCEYHVLILVSLGQYLEAVGRVEGAYRIWSEAGSPEVTKDEEIAPLVKQKLGMLAFELTGNERHLGMQLEALKVVHGEDAVAVANLIQHTKRLAQRVAPNDRDCEQAARECIRLAKALRETGGSEDAILNAYSVALKTMFSISDVSCWEALVRHIFSEARSHLRGASQSRIEEFHSLERMFQRAQGIMVPLAPPKRPFGRFNESLKLLASRQTDRPVEISGKDLDIRACRQLLQEIVSAECDGNGFDGARDLRSILRFANGALASVKASALTPESLQLVRDNLDVIARCVLFLLLSRNDIISAPDFSRASQEEKSPVTFQATIQRGCTDEWDVWEHSLEFFCGASDWLGSAYRTSLLASRLAAVGKADSSTFRVLRDELARELANEADGVFFDEELEDEVNQVALIARDAELSRCLLNARGIKEENTQPSKRMPQLSELGNRRAIAFVLPLIAFRGVSNTPIVLLTFERDRLHVWSSEHRAKLWDDVTALVETRSGEHVLAAIDAISESFPDDASKSFALSAPRVSHVRVCDLTGRGVPLSLIEGGDNWMLISNGCSSHDEVELPSKPRISFWSALPSAHRESAKVNGQLRRVEVQTMDGVVTLQYPRLPKRLAMRFESRPTPLVFSHFERWDFEALEQASRCEVEYQIGRNATRDAFLAQKWCGIDVLHISMHARAYRAYPDAAHFLFNSSDTAPGIVHLFDIVSTDLSSVKLVFLSACETSSGRAQTGNEPQSLAWAFRAAGAAAVIATRWEVADAAAWYFSHRLYSRWIGEGDSLESSFRRALNALQAHPAFCKPSVWGAFVLHD